MPKKPTPEQLAKEEERRRKEFLAQEKQLEAARLVRKQNALRMVVLRETYKVIDGIYKKIAKITAGKERDSLWARYVDCQNTPYGQMAMELRDYLYQWNRSIEDEQREQHDWMLLIDERSLLNQSPFRADVSERKLRSKHTNPADPFPAKIGGALKILDEIDDVLGRPGHFRLGAKSVEDIRSIRSDIQDQHWTYFDYLTFTVTGNIDREMHLLDATRAEYLYSTDIFAIGMFTNRDVPLAPIELDAEKSVVAFDPMHFKVKCPHHMTFEKSVLRVVWCSFDHCSDYAPSFNLRFTDAEYIQRNLLDSCRQEIEIREAMEQKLLNRMKKERAEYDALMAAEADKPPQKAEAGNKAKKVKRIIEPPRVTERTVVDMLPQYLSTEQDEHHGRMMKLHPDVLKLSASELNLRKSSVLGGTYVVHFLERPVQSRKFQNHLFQRTYTQPDILKYHKYITHYTPVTFASDCSLTGAQRDKILKNEAKEWNDLIELTVRLPANVCWWQQPQVVRWQLWEDSEEFRKMRDDMQHYNLHFKEIEAHKESRLFNRIQVINEDEEADVVLDFDLVNRSEEMKLYYLMTKHIVPRLSLTYQFECEVHEEREKLALELKRREHLRREFEEDLKLRREQAITARIRQRKENRVAELLAEREAHRLMLAEEAGLSVDELPEDEEPLPTVQTVHIDMSNIADNLDLGEFDDGAEMVEFKNIVQAAPARELFPAAARCPPIEIRPHMIRFSLTSRSGPSALFLSDLLHQIDEYNMKELPFFKDKYRAEVEEEPADSESETEEVEEVKGHKKKGGGAAKSRGKARSTTPSMASRIIRATCDLHLVPHNKGKWVTDGIYVQNYDEESHTITFKTTHIGTFGFAVNKYHNFPLTDWQMKPNYDEIPMSVKIALTGREIKLELTVSPDGFRLTILKPRPSICPVKPPEADWMSLAELQDFLRAANMNIFPEIDAYWYIGQGEGLDGASNDDRMISYKHEPMANHSYAAFGYFCQTHELKRSVWNRLAGRREAILQARQVVENRTPEAFVEVRVTPVDAYFVRTEELCTPLSEVVLEYHMEPPAQEFSCDLFDLLTAQSVDKSKKKQQNTNVQLSWNVIEFMRSVQVLSYS